MSILLFEWLTGGGLERGDIPIDDSCVIQRQGRQMMVAIASDFLDAGFDLVVVIGQSFRSILPDHPRLGKILVGPDDDLKVVIQDAAGRCDQIMLIAPESDRCLIECVTWCEPFSHKLISPNRGFVSIASCKIATFETLHANGFTAFPRGARLSDVGQHDPHRSSPVFSDEYPLVLKPIDGAGSEGVQFIPSRDAWQMELIESPERFRIERFIRGTAVSVSVLGGATCEILAPTLQIFDKQPFGNYLQSGYPIEHEISERAIRLARAVMQSLPPTLGYVGLDMVIGGLDEPDCLIEVNPRLTLSYLKLREIYDANLALAMIQQSVGYHTIKEGSSDRNCIFREPDL